MVRKDVFGDIYTRLEAERAQLRMDIDSLEIENQNQATDYGIGNHLADNATELFLRERNIALRNNAQDLLEQVEAALLRIDGGTYGICANCGREIAVERLEALPYATLCITCQSEAEHSR